MRVKSLIIISIIILSSLVFTACKNPFSKEDSSSQNSTNTPAPTFTGVVIGIDPTTDLTLAPQLIKDTVLWDSSGKVVTGTMEDRGTWDLTSAFLGEGHYSGVSNLPNSNQVCTGNTILGVTGAAVCQSGTATTLASTSQILSGFQAWDSTGTLMTGTMTSQGSLNASLSFPGAGYYSGTVTNLPTTSQVCSSVNVLGVTGAAVCQSGSTTSPAGVGNILNGLEAWSATGNKITGTMPNRGSLDATQSFPGNGYYSGIVTNSPTAATICSGNTVLGIAGTAICGAPATPYSSNANRDKNTTQITQLQETVTYAGTSLPNNYREMPFVSKDDDGSFSSNATKVVRTTFVNCGLTQTTITARISDCATLNGVNATWDGQVKGNNGFGVWKLVTRTAANIEVWRDERTGLLWSSKVATSKNWCKASGNNNSSVVTNTNFKENDPNGTCTNSSNQNTTTAPISYCLENAQFDTSNVNAAGKAGLKASSTPTVRWRLPTLNDYLQAQVDGINLVLPDFSTSYEWTATINSANTSQAWMYRPASTIIATNPRSNNRDVRCVGR